MKNIFKPLFTISLVLLVGLSVAQMDSSTSFTVTIENVSAQDSLSTSNGYVPTPLAPGFWLVHNEANKLFTAGQGDYGHGLEALAEDGNPDVLLEHYAMTMMAAYGVFNTPVGAMEAGPLLPGASYSFSFDAQEGDRLSFATMFVQSNDLFYAPSASGIALFDAMGEPIHGDISNQISLWDAGTEVDEEAGQGMHQPLSQMAANSGDDENAAVRVTEQMLSLNGQLIRVIIEVK